MNRLLLLAGLTFGCATPADDTSASSCDPSNNDYETAGCACTSDDACTCQVFDGAQFHDASEPSACQDDGTCIPCFYE